MFLSIDIGGTKTLLALFTFHGLCLKRLRFPTNPDQTAYVKDLIGNLTHLLKSANQRQKIRAITVAIPGQIKFSENSYTFICPNLPWQDIDLYTPLQKLFKEAKIFFANDANLATLYETQKLKKSLRLQKAIYLTFSTGIGGGISENGQLSPRSTAFEPGHQKYQYIPKTTSIPLSNPQKPNVAKSTNSSSHTFSDIKKSFQEWEDIASAKAIGDFYHSRLTDLSLTETIKQEISSRLVLGLKDIILSELPQTIIIGGPMGLLFHRLKPTLLSALNNSLSSSSNTPSKSINSHTNPTQNLPSKASSSPSKPSQTTNTIPTLISAKKPLESTIYGAYLYSRQNYNQ